MLLGSQGEPTRTRLPESIVQQIERCIRPYFFYGKMQKLKEKSARGRGVIMNSCLMKKYPRSSTVEEKKTGRLHVKVTVTFLHII